MSKKLTVAFFCVGTNLDVDCHIFGMCRHSECVLKVQLCRSTPVKIIFVSETLTEVMPLVTKKA